MKKLKNMKKSEKNYDLQFEYKTVKYDWFTVLEYPQIVFNPNTTHNND